MISLRSHPVWAAAQRRAGQRLEDMRRHPSFVARQNALAAGQEVAAAAVVRRLHVCRDTDALA